VLRYFGSLVWPKVYFAVAWARALHPLPHAYGDQKPLAKQPAFEHSATSKRAASVSEMVSAREDFRA
jgi:hypothetical protein